MEHSNTKSAENVKEKGRWKPSRSKVGNGGRNEKRAIINPKSS